MCLKHRPKLRRRRRQSATISPSITVSLVVSIGAIAHRIAEVARADNRDDLLVAELAGPACQVSTATRVRIEKR